MSKENIALETVDGAAKILIHFLCLDTNATKAEYSIEGLTYKGEPKGSWNVTVEKL